MAIEVSKRTTLTDLHTAAKSCTCGRAAGRMTAIANVLSGEHIRFNTAGQIEGLF